MQAFFAKMPGKSEIRPHSDETNIAITAQLGLIIPENECHINCGDVRHDWRRVAVPLDVAFLSPWKRTLIFCGSLAVLWNGDLCQHLLTWQLRSSKPLKIVDD